MHLPDVMRAATKALDRGEHGKFKAWSLTLRLLGVHQVHTPSGVFIGWSRGEQRWTAYGDER